MTSLTDASGNETTWTFGATGQVIAETQVMTGTDLVTTFEYDAAGNLLKKTAPLRPEGTTESGEDESWYIEYEYDNLLRQTTEKWYTTVYADPAPYTIHRLTYTTTYDTASRVASVSDGSTALSYTYSIFGNLTSQTQSLNGLADDVTFSYRYDAAGRKTLVASKIGTTENYINEYDYDSLGRIVKVTQSGTNVAEKRVDFGYSDDGLSSTITRYADLAGEKMVAATDQAFDAMGRVESITHRRTDEVFADYDYTWDEASRITAIDMDFSAGTLRTEYDDTATYNYDNTSQLTDADYVTQTDEDYDYDETGNRTLVDGTESYTTGDHNQMLSDSTFYYTYDSEGNQTGKYSDSQCTVPVEKRFWDHRNRLTKVEIYSGGSLSKTVEYAYDAMNRMYSRVVAADNTRTIFVHDETNQIVLDFTDDNTGDVTNSDLSARRLWHPGTIDHCLAEEQPAAGNVYYPFVDHLNTVRQVGEYNSTNNTTSIVKQITRNAYGLVLTDSAPSILILPGHTGKYEDPITKDSWHWQRWHDLSTGRWRSIDPISFAAGDVNLYRYVNNSPGIAHDPTGLTRHVFVYEGAGGFAGVGAKPPQKPWDDPSNLKEGTLAGYTVSMSQALNFIVHRLQGLRDTEIHYDDWNGSWSEYFGLANQYTTEGMCHTLVLIGYSYGGGEVASIVEAKKKMPLMNLTVRFDLVATVDPVARGRVDVSPATKGEYNLVKTSNVKKWINFYQRIDTDSLAGVPIYGDTVKGADVDREFTKSDMVKSKLYKASESGAYWWLSNTSIQNYAHIWLPAHETVLDEIYKAVTAVPTQQPNKPLTGA